MPKRYFAFENLLPCHVINRGVDKRIIFLEESDYYRFIFQIYAANFGAPAPSIRRKDIIKAAKSILRGEEIPTGLVVEEHPPLVYILTFSLMPNHIHFNLAQVKEGGISKFMQKLTCSYAHFFNTKYERTGTLFEGRFKAIPIKTETQLDAVTRYIHLNSLEIFEKDWKKKGLEGWEKAAEFLTSYQWSSYPDYIGIRHSLLIPPRQILKMFYGEFIPENQENYQKFIEDYLAQNLVGFYPHFLEE
jgi:putative transposase